MFIVIAGQESEIEEWMEREFQYIYRQKDLEKVDPTKVSGLFFVGNYDRNPLYFTDELLELQMKIAKIRADAKAARSKPLLTKADLNELVCYNCGKREPHTFCGPFEKVWRKIRRKSESA